MAIKGKTKNGTLSEQFHNTMEKSQLDFKNLTKFPRRNYITQQTKNRRH